MLFSDKGDANKYLTGSVVMCHGEPVRVLNVRTHSFEHNNIPEKWIVSIVRLDFKTVDYVAFNELDFTPFKLGYFYDKKHKTTYYVKKIPVRAWRAGLSSKNLEAFGAVKFPYDDDDVLYRMLTHKYPKIEKALCQAKEFNALVPFNPDFAINHRASVFYKTKYVGMFDGKSINLFKRFKFLKELTKEKTRVPVR